MLTAEALSDRKWGHLPALRRLLEKKGIPPSYYGLTSVSDNMFNGLVHLTEIVVVVKEYETYIQENTELDDLPQLLKDLDWLKENLYSASSFFNKQAEFVNGLQRQIIVDRLSQPSQ